MTLPLACCTGTDPAFCSGICCLMRFLRSDLIEVLAIGMQDTMQLLLLQDEQEVIETLAPHTA